MSDTNLFSDDAEEARAAEPAAAAARQPLAARMRPQSLEEVLGQDHILGPGKLLRRVIEADRLTNLIFYGPPGCGKTTLAEVIAFGEQARQKMIDLEQRDVQLIRLDDELAQIQAELVDAGQKLAAQRRKVAPKLSSAVMSELAQLGFRQSQFSVPSSRFSENQLPVPSCQFPEEQCRHEHECSAIRKID